MSRSTYMKLKDLSYFASDISSIDCDLIQRYFTRTGIKGKAVAFNLLEIKKNPGFLKSLPKSDVCFLFKATDPLELSKGHKVGENIIVRVKVKNNDNVDYEIKTWSYVYRGSKSYSGDKEGNKEEFNLAAGEIEIIELKNIVLEAESGQYNLKVKVNKNNQKTNYEITKPITIQSIKEEKTKKKEEVKKNIKKKIMKKSLDQR